MIFISKKIPIKRSPKKESEVIRKRARLSGISIIHQDCFKGCPKEKHLWWLMPQAFPASFQTKAGKVLPILRNPSEVMKFLIQELM